MESDITREWIEAQGAIFTANKSGPWSAYFDGEGIAVYCWNNLEVEVDIEGHEVPPTRASVLTLRGLLAAGAEWKSRRLKIS